MSIGIYAIVNNTLNKVYLGKSKHIEKRWNEHRANLNTNLHHNKELQHDWFKYGSADFSFYIIQHCSEHEIDYLEKEIIARYRKNNLYNYNWKKHPWALVNLDNKSSSVKYTKDKDGDLLPLKHCPNCNLDKLANSFFDSIYCFECQQTLEDELQEEIEILQTTTILTGESLAPKEKPVIKYKFFKN